jgi:hypothetical protein
VICDVTAEMTRLKELGEAVAEEGTVR